MLTTFQASPIAFWADEVPGFERGDGPFCGDCAEKLAGGERESGEHDELFIHYYNTPVGFQPASRYGVEEAYPGGVNCARCKKTIVEPDEDYCLEHGEERQWDRDGNATDRCYYGELHEVECRFPEQDSNPAVPRWVPCSTCGAGDGEPHREGCEALTR